MEINSRGVKWMTVGLSALLTGVIFASIQGASATPAEAGSSRTYLVQLEEPPTMRVFHQNRSEGNRIARQAARDQKREITTRQNQVIERLPDGVEVIYRTHSVLAGIGVTTGSAGDRQLEEIPGVRAVYPVAPKRPQNAYAVPFQAAPAAWQDTGFRGQGQKIAVIDTGLDYTHANFGGEGTTEAYDQAHAASDQPMDPDSYDPAKMIGGYDLVGDDFNPDSDSPDYQPVPKPDPNPLDCEGHGSHVAGTAAGFGVKADQTTYDGPYDASTDFESMTIGPGVAPEAGVIAIKAFGCKGTTTVVAKAIDRALDPDGDGDPSDRADVINLSLGTNFGSALDGDSLAANAAVNLGVSVITSAGNAGDHTDISGSPGNATRTLSVASSVDAQSKADAARVNIGGTESLRMVERAGRYTWKGQPDLSGPVIAAPAENETACTPYEGTPFTGQVVIVRWHDATPECSSAARGANLAAAGAAGYIFGSDSDSFSAGINGDDRIPGVLMSASGANAIRTALAEETPVTVEGTLRNAITLTDEALNDKVSGFSSRGHHAAGNLKPDVAAVGQSVFSAEVGAGSGGTGMSGTSMASPMVAGLAALVRQANPGWNPLQVKAGIMNTASHDLFVRGAADPASDRYGPPRVGAGRIDVARAVAGKVLAYNPEGGSVSVSFGPVEAASPVELDHQITVDNQSGAAATYDVRYESIHAVPGAEFTVSPAEVTVEPGQTSTVTVTLTIDDPASLTKAVDPTVGRMATSGDPRETLAETFGRVLFESEATGSTLRVPVYAAPRPVSAMTQPGSLQIHRGAGDPPGADQTAILKLEGKGIGGSPGENGNDDGDPVNDIESLAAGFGLTAVSPPAPDCGGPVQSLCRRLAEDANVDISMVGFSSDAHKAGSPEEAKAYFAVATYGPWSVPASKISLRIYLDFNQDSVPDLTLANGRDGSHDVFVGGLIDPLKPEESQLIGWSPMNDRFGDVDTALYDSNVMVLPVSLATLAEYGVNPENPRVDYGILGISTVSEQTVDAISVDPDSRKLVDPLTVDLYRSAVTVTDPEEPGLLVRDQPGRELTVRRNLDAWKTESGLDLMMIHFHNQNGSKAERVTLRGADSLVRLAVSAQKLTAKVSGKGKGLPVPAGKVTFRVGGKVVGTSQVVDGVATLKHRVAPGATRVVNARYSGDADFEASSAQVRRNDPRLTARVSSRARKNHRGWYRFPVKVSFRCVPHGSALVGKCPAARHLGRDGRGQTVKATIAARDGGRATVTVTGLNIDRTAPVVRIRGVRAGAIYRRVRRARCVARDRTSGVLNCRLNRKRRGKRVTYFATATDKAGNRKSIRVRIRLRR